MRKKRKDKAPYRHELKYVCTQAQLAILNHRIQAVCRLDEHTGANGGYVIRSVYFDTPENSGYYDNELGANPRTKYRIRIYNHDTDHIKLERKSKFDTKTYKESCSITRQQCLQLLNGAFLWTLEDSMAPLLKHFYIEYKNKLLRPKIIVEYDRIPYVYHDGNVRITFDRNISSCHSILDFLNESIPKRPVMPCGQHILEVKYDQFLPDVIYNALQLRELHHCAYSKYYMCRKFS